MEDHRFLHLIYTQLPHWPVELLKTIQVARLNPPLTILQCTETHFLVCRDLRKSRSSMLFRNALSRRKRGAVLSPRSLAPTSAVCAVMAGEFVGKNNSRLQQSFVSRASFTGTPGRVLMDVRNHSISEMQEIVVKHDQLLYSGPKNTRGSGWTRVCCYHALSRTASLQRCGLVSRN